MQNDILKKEIEAQNKQKDNLVGRANEAEEKIQELNLKLENVCWSIVICFCITYSIVEWCWILLLLTIGIITY